MNHIDFYRLRPTSCQRYAEEVEINFDENSDFAIEHIDLQNSGIAAVATKRF